MSTISDPLTPDMRRAARAFQLGTGVPCFFIDSRGRRFLPDAAPNAAEAFCAHCLKSRDGSCAQVCLYGLYQAERFGGKYVFFCPSGLTYCVSPVITEENDISAFFAGPMLMMDADEFLLEDLMIPAAQELGTTPKTRLSALRERIADLPVVPADRVTALSDLVFHLADSLSTTDFSRFHRQQKELSNKAAVSESIHALKRVAQAGHMSHYPLDKERELLTKISLGDKAGAQRILNDILGYVFFSTGQDFNIIRARVQELVVMLSRGALEGGADIDEIFGLNHRYLDDIRHLQNLEDLTVWLSKILERFTDCVFNLVDIRHKDVIFQAVNYIRRHFTGHISLDDVAQHVHLNASYLSRVFKEEMQTNFVAYVNELRVETAKRLLLDSNVPLPEVAGMVGFEEQSYFTKVFKKVTGTTPGRYRESRGLKHPPTPHQTASPPHTDR